MFYRCLCTPPWADTPLGRNPPGRNTPPLWADTPSGQTPPGRHPAPLADTSSWQIPPATACILVNAFLLLFQVRQCALQVYIVSKNSYIIDPDLLFYTKIWTV